MKKVHFFNRHLTEAQEGYLEHFIFAFTTSLWLFVTSVMLLCHAIFPFTFTITASSNVRKINELMQKRFSSLITKKEKKSAIAKQVQ